jgi:hypothetical protein
MTAIWLAPEPVRLEIVPIEAPVLSFTASPTVKLGGVAGWAAAPGAVALAGAPELWADGADWVDGWLGAVGGDAGSDWVDGCVEGAAAGGLASVAGGCEVVGSVGGTAPCDEAEPA